MIKSSFKNGFGRASEMTEKDEDVPPVPSVAASPRPGPAGRPSGGRTPRVRLVRTGHWGSRAGLSGCWAGAGTRHRWAAGQSAGGWDGGSKVSVCSSSHGTSLKLRRNPAEENVRPQLAGLCDCPSDEVITVIRVPLNPWKAPEIS